MTTQVDGFAWWLSAFSAAGGMYQGYCIGLVSGLMDNQWKTFQDHFPDVKRHQNQPNPFTFIFLFAAVLAATPLCAAQIADRLGRKNGLLLFSYLAVIGGALMAAADAQVALDIGRAFSGVAVGGISVLVPLYQSEIAPGRLRGMLLSTVCTSSSACIAAAGGHLTTSRVPHISCAAVSDGAHTRHHVRYPRRHVS